MKKGKLKNILIGVLVFIGLSGIMLGADLMFNESAMFIKIFKGKEYNDYASIIFTNSEFRECVYDSVYDELGLLAAAGLSNNELNTLKELTTLTCHIDDSIIQVDNLFLFESLETIDFKNIVTNDYPKLKNLKNLSIDGGHAQLNLSSNTNLENLTIKNATSTTGEIILPNSEKLNLNFIDNPNAVIDFYADSTSMDKLKEVTINIKNSVLHKDALISLLHPMTYLKTFNISSDKEYNLDFYTNLLLNELKINMPITTLDLSRNTRLTNLYVKNSLLEELDLAVNSNLTDVSFEQNSKLANIVFDQTNSVTKFTAINTALTTMDEIKIPNLTTLTLNNTNIAKLDLYDYSNLSYIAVTNNANLTNIDLSGNSKLTNVNIINNSKLKMVDLTKNSGITQLNLELTAQKNLLVGKVFDLQSLPTKLIKLPSVLSDLVKISEVISDSTILDKNQSGDQLLGKDKGNASVDVKYDNMGLLIAMNILIHYDVNVEQLESSKYIINHDNTNIYTGMDIDEESILKNIELSNAFITSVSDNKLYISENINENPLKVYTIKNVSFGSLDVSGKNISLSAGTTFSDFVKQTNPQGVSLQILDGTTAVTNGVLKTGMILKIYVDTEEVDSYTLTVPELSKVNTLKSLTVSGATITFDKDITTYELTINDAKTTISAVADDTKAKVEGTGEKTLNMGLNVFQIKVTAEDGSIKTYVISITREKDELEFGNLVVDNINNYIKDIQVGTKISTLKSQITTNGIITFKDVNGNNISDSSLAKTGNKVEIKFASQTLVFTLSVKGDVNGDGNLTVSDIVKINNHIIDSTKKLNGVYFESADYNRDTKLSVSDIVKINAQILGGN